MGFEDHIAFHLLSFAAFSVSRDIWTHVEDDVDASKSQSGCVQGLDSQDSRVSGSLQSDSKPCSNAASDAYEEAELCALPSDQSSQSFSDDEAASQNTGDIADIQEALDTIPEIIKIFANQEIWINAGLVHRVGTGDEYGVYTHAKSKDLIARITITDVKDIYSVARYSSGIWSEADDFQIQLGYRAILTKLARPRAYVKLFSGANGSWERILKESLWLQHLHLDEKAPVDIPCFSVDKLDNYQYTILDFKDETILNLPPLLSSTPYISDRIVTILEHLAKYTSVQSFDNRRANDLTDSDFRIGVEAGADDLDLDKSGSSIIVPHDSSVYIEFHNLTEEALYITMLNLTPLRQIECLYAGIVPPGVLRVNVIMTVPARLREQKQSACSVEDIFKFIVSTNPIGGVESMELPGPWDVVEYDTVAVHSPYKVSWAPVQESLVKKSKGPGQLRNEDATVKWVCRSITIRTVLETN